MSRVSGWLARNSTAVIITLMLAIVVFFLVRSSGRQEAAQREQDAIQRTLQTSLDTLAKVSDGVRIQGETLARLADILDQLKAVQASQKAEAEGRAADAEARAATAETQRKELAATIVQFRRQVDESFRQQEFVVRQAPTKPGEPIVLVAKPAETAAPCQPAVGLGNVGVLPGVACVTPP